MVKSSRCDVNRVTTTKFPICCIMFTACENGIHEIKIVKQEEGVALPSEADDGFFGVKWFEEYCSGLTPAELPKLCLKDIGKFAEF